MYTVPWLYTLSMIFLLIAQLPHLAFTRVSLDILANISAVSTNSMDCLSKIVEMAWKAKNTDNTLHVEVVGTCCNIYQYKMRIPWKVYTQWFNRKKKCQCHKKSNRNLWNYGTSWNIQKEQIKKFPLAKNQPLSANWCEGTSTIML